MSLRRTLMVAAMHARDLGRRRLALAILILLPLAFYFSAELTPVDPEIEAALTDDPQQRAAAQLWIVVTGALGAGWTVAIAALFVVLGARHADQQLLLARFRPIELLLGRMATVVALATVLMPLVALVIRTQRDVDLPLLIVATYLSALVAAAIGVLAAALVPREMEGVLVVIGVVGIQMSVDGQRWMPLWGAVEMVKRSIGIGDAAAAGTATIHALVFTTVLLAVAATLWTRRIRLHRSTRLLLTRIPPSGAR